MSKKLPPDEGKRVPLNMRTTREVRQQLEESAKSSGRSLAQEIEYRLEQSLKNDNLEKIESAIIGDVQTLLLLRGLRVALSVAADVAQQYWPDDTNARHRVIIETCNEIAKIVYDVSDVAHLDTSSRQMVIDLARASSEIWKERFTMVDRKIATKQSAVAAVTRAILGEDRK